MQRNEPSTGDPVTQTTKEIPKLLPPEEAAIASEDRRAEQEAAQLASGRSTEDLQKEALHNEHARNEEFRDLFNRLVKWGMVIAFLIAMLFSLSWAWHLITPTSWHWLSEEEISHIQNIVTGGVLASLVGDHFKRRLG